MVIAGVCRVSGWRNLRGGSQGGTETAQGAIPVLPEGRGDGGPQPPADHLLHDAAGPPEDHPGDDLQELARAMAYRDDLALAPLARGHPAWLWVAAATAALGTPPQHVRRVVGFPAAAQPHEEEYLPYEYATHESRLLSSPGTASVSSRCFLQ
jgi:hypothetical protein